MTWFDILLIAIVAGSIIGGFRDGFVRLGIGLIALIAGFVTASWFYGMVGGWYAQWLGVGRLANFAGFVTILLVVIIAGGIVSLILARMLHLVGLGTVDRLGGAAFGAVRGLLLCLVLVTVTLAFTKTPPDALVRSHFAPYLVGPARQIVKIAPYELRDSVRSAYEDLRDIWDDVAHPKKKRKIAAEEL